MPSPKKDNEYSKEEAEQRFQQTLRGALVTPHKPHVKPEKKTKTKRSPKVAK